MMMRRRFQAVWIGLSGVLVASGTSGGQAAPLPSAAPTERAQLVGYLRHGRDDSTPKMSAAQITQLYGNRIPNPFAVILQQSDWLRLAPTQSDSLGSLNRGFTRATSDIWTPIGAYLAALPKQYDVVDAWSRVSAAFTAQSERLIPYGVAADALLTRDQHLLLAPAIRALLIPACIRRMNPVAIIPGRGSGATVAVDSAGVPVC